MIDSIVSLYSWRYPSNVVYMLQATEYQIAPYLRWYWQTTNFNRVSHRRELQKTKAAGLLLLALRMGMLLELLIGLGIIWRWRNGDFSGGWEFGLALIIATPIVWAQLIVLPLVLGRLLIVKPRTYMLVRRSERIFQGHPATKVAVTGSYGKTTMKEMLATVLGSVQKVAVTPGNKNVAVSHAHFARALQGDEKVLIIEYGEWGPGDVARFAATTHPSHAVITGVAPAHLDRYKTVEAAGEDIFSVAKFVKPQQVYVNAESSFAKSFIRKTYKTYSDHGALGWTARDIQNDITGISFSLHNGKEVMHLKSGLVGRHQIGPISLVAGLARQLGLTITEIESAVASTKAFEHRMQPYRLQGAWIIDDTYNGNVEGVRVGTELLKELSATRKIYVTPGLVDQGRETQRVHETIGAYVAQAAPDMVVLMKNSVTRFIQHGLNEAGYKGQVIIEEDPLEFYTNLGLFVASGDLVLLQNDWPDNYA